MATLAQVTRETRLVMKLFAVLLILGTVVFIGVNGTNFIREVFFPAPPAPPEEKFGKLPPILFEENTPKEVDYRINTVQGTLPIDTPDRLRVYAIKKVEANILALQNVRSRLANAEYTAQESKLTNTLYQWTNPDVGSIIKYELLTNNFVIGSNFLADSALESPKRISDNATLVGYIVNFLNLLQDDTSDLNLTQPVVQYFIVRNQTLEPAKNIQNASVARVDLFQNNIEVTPFTIFGVEYGSLPIYYPGINESTINFYLAAVGFNSQEIVEAHYTHYPVDTQLHSTYPIKTAEKAFEDLKAGKAFILNNNTAQTIDITDVTLGYYLGEQETEFLQPVYVFKGENFQAYVQAVADSSILIGQ